MKVTRVYKVALPADGTNAVQLIAGANLATGKKAQLRSLRLVTDNTAALVVSMGVSGDERKIATLAALESQNVPLNADGIAQWTGAGGDLYVKLNAAIAANKELHIYATFSII